MLPLLSWALALTALYLLLRPKTTWLGRGVILAGCAWTVLLFLWLEQVTFECRGGGCPGPNTADSVALTVATVAVLGLAGGALTRSAGREATRDVSDSRIASAVLFLVVFTSSLLLLAARAASDGVLLIVSSGIALLAVVTARRLIAGGFAQEGRK